MSDWHNPEENLAFDPDKMTIPRCDIEELRQRLNNLKDAYSNLVEEYKYLKSKYQLAEDALLLLRSKQNIVAMGALERIKHAR